MSNLPALLAAEALVVRQQQELTEVFSSLETRNRYAIELPNGHTVLYAAETGEGAGAFLSRNLLANKRPFHISLRDASGSSAMELRRPWTWFFSQLHVFAGDGTPLGRIEQRFAIFSKRFSVFDPAGAEIATLHGPMLRPWTFRVLAREQEVGQITKQWSGLLKEAFTNADTFGVQFGPAMDPRLRMLALAATFLIDFLYFEKQS
jgi:uncharacterized protein YxjI